MVRRTTVLTGELAAPYPRVGVFVVTWNKKADVLALLDSLQEHPYPNWRVTVVDNDSSDGTAAAIGERHPWVRCIRMPVNLGGTGGFNAGLCQALRDADYDYVWLLDNDVVVEPGALEVLVETLERRGDAAAAGSHMIQRDFADVTNEIGGDVDLTRGRLLLNRHRTASRAHRDEVYEVDYLAAASLVVRFDVLRQVGIWDDFFIHYDDVDWCLRIKKAGYKVLACAASRIRHVSARSKPVTWVLYYDLRNMLYLQHKHNRPGFGHYAFFTALLHAYAMRDELSGKTYYQRLAREALRDFFSGRIGKRDDLPPLSLSPARDIIEQMEQQRPRRVWILEPIRVPDLLEGLSADARRGLQVTGICGEHSILPEHGPRLDRRLRLPANRLALAARVAVMWLTSRRADYLVLDLDAPCGLLGLCAKRIVLLVGDSALIVPGGWRRLISALAVPLRWLPVFWRCCVFGVTRPAPNAGVYESPAAFETKVAAIRGAQDRSSPGGRVQAS